MVSEELTRENLEGKTIVDLNQLCRDHEVKGVIGRPKGDMVNYMVAFNEGRPVEGVMAEQGQASPETVQPPAESGTPGSEPAAGEGTEGWQNLGEVTEEAASEPEAEAGEEVEESRPESPGPPAEPETSEPAQEESAEPETVQSQSV